MYALLRPFLFALDPTTAHAAAMLALAPLEHLAPLRAALRGLSTVTRDPRLEVRKMGLVFPSPLGVAAGLDKNGERARALAALGFGHVELGTVTAEAQGPNPPPNLFRLPADRALVNRLGFPNEGASVVGPRILARRGGVGVPVGVSIGKSRSVPVEIEAALPDYVTSIRAVRDAADFLVVNVSSPNTKDLRALQAADVARVLFAALMKETAGRPLLVKIAPDLADDAIDAICMEADRAGLAGVVATNTTVARTGLATPAEEIERIGAGGLSGVPLFPRALAVVKRARTQLGPDACVIGVGGIHGTDSALAMLQAGADLIQVYTSFVYEGPFLPRAIARGMLNAIAAESGAGLADVVGHPRGRAAAGSSPSVRGESVSAAIDSSSK
ncbi:MAG: quinone-dependent dihydroorotate dehydrogenase [Labilithrix sp.]|nr:quinone-dependent dihydroorotate dehydrogenase [Labilithrix sp.]MCW5811708.1 quinone-dependent dihydroorotate dehydrogenase [Labilithrix sp.]